MGSYGDRTRADGGTGHGTLLKECVPLCPVSLRCSPSRLSRYVPFVPLPCPVSCWKCDDRANAGHSRSRAFAMVSPVTQPSQWWEFSRNRNRARRAGRGRPARWRPRRRPGGEVAERACGCRPIAPPPGSTPVRVLRPSPPPTCRQGARTGRLPTRARKNGRVRGCGRPGSP